VSEATGEAEEGSAEEKQDEPKGGGKKAPGAGQMTAAQAAALGKELEQLSMATIGALSSMGTATEGVLEGGNEVALGALDRAAASGAGVSGDALGGLKIGGGGGTITPGAVGTGLGGIGKTGQGAAGTVGTQKKVKGPRGTANVAGARPVVGAVSNALAVVAGMRAGFRACYQRELNSNPEASGRISLTIKVGPGGEVQSVQAAPSGNLGSAVACVRARAAAAQFAPPEGGTAVIQVPVTFVKQ
jgi:hypothetical protein